MYFIVLIVLFLLVVFFFKSLGAFGAAQSLVVPGDQQKAEMSVLLAQTSGETVRDFFSRANGSCDQGISVLMPYQAAITVQNMLRPKLPVGVGAMIGEVAEDEADVELILAPATADSEFIWLMQSDVANTSVEIELLIAELSEWHRQYGIDIYQVGYQALSLRLLSPPADSRILANNIAQRWPQTLEYYGGDVERLERQVIDANLSLRWCKTFV